MPFMGNTRRPAACVWHGARRIQPKRRKWPLIIDAELLERLRDVAKAQNKTMSWLVCDAITAHLATLNGDEGIVQATNAVNAALDRQARRRRGTRR